MHSIKGPNSRPCWNHIWELRDSRLLPGSLCLRLTHKETSCLLVETKGAKKIFSGSLLGLMLLPLSYSLPNNTDSDDGSIYAQLQLANTNAEYNRVQCFHSDDDYPETVIRNPVRVRCKGINFHPEVSVRYIPSRAKTANVGSGETSSYLMLNDSPVPPDSKLLLKECSPVSDDEDFNRFYRTMESNVACLPIIQARCRTFSLDCLNDYPQSSPASRRPRSMSCDDLFLPALKL